MNHLGKNALYLLLAAYALPPLPALQEDEKQGVKEEEKKEEKGAGLSQVSGTVINIAFKSLKALTSQLPPLLSPGAEPLRLALLKPSPHIR